MYCPNCAKVNSNVQKFCRACGLNLEKTAEILSEQLTSSEMIRRTKFLKFYETLGKLGLGGLIGGGLTGFMLLLVNSQINSFFPVNQIKLFWE